jgi:hypothetical protein
MAANIGERIGSRQCELWHSRPMPKSAAAAHPAPDRPLPARLEAALAAVADVLAELPKADWDALCAEEQMTMMGTFQYWEALGWPDVMLPAHTLGSHILNLFAARYPFLAQDAAGTA